MRGSEYLTRSDMFREAFGGGPDTWYTVPVDDQGPTMVVSMYFAPAAQAITEVSEQGTDTVRGTEVTVYRATLDPAKFQEAIGAAGLPPGLATPTQIEYGVGADGYVHSIAFDMAGMATTIEPHSYNSTLSIPEPSDVMELPVS